MMLEHFAVNVEEPVLMSDWYKEHLGLQVVKNQLNLPIRLF